ncbi:DNA-methyltransferase [Alteracholeplasma palmae J233]|uniref:site-specific DNA-methyltransferase (adenine-specific) n=1 Tax=Alteracholeplasma palmae (strain ATCC 49389 / J233) TaxID=1318466 RepID=U4KJQ2_ALTPJ|nr:DNA adenine methylase [Alteracholeplasma palmae]CCV63769.1 DNA-methyltransferase [Alteracholeplasma palmae J233]
MASYTPLRYPGGKAKLYNFVSELIKDNFTEPPVYVEGYAGGSGLALKLLLNNDVSKIYINDYDYAIYAFWYSLLNRTDEFIELINNTPVTVEQWRIQKDIYLNPNTDVLTKGFSAFFLNRTNRSGIITAGPIGGYQQLGNYKIDCRFNKDKLIENIRTIADRKEDIHVYNLDGVEFLQQIDNQENNALIYLDPPYVEQGKALYKNAFDEQAHRALASSVGELQNKWFVTYDDNPLIVELYNGFGINRFEIGYTVEKKRRALEIAVFSPRLVNIDVEKMTKKQKVSE